METTTVSMPTTLPASSYSTETWVFAVGEDEDWGKYVRVRSAGDIDAVYYGFEEVKVRAGETVAAGQLLGTVPVGRRVYFAVSEKGAPQDPRAYVSLTVQKQA